MRESSGGRDAPDTRRATRALSLRISRVYRRNLRRHPELRDIGVVIAASAPARTAERWIPGLVAGGAAAVGALGIVAMVETESWWFAAVVAPVLVLAVLTVAFMRQRLEGISVIGEWGAAAIRNGDVAIVPWSEVETVRIGTRALSPTGHGSTRRWIHLVVENAFGAAVALHLSVDGAEPGNTSADRAIDLAQRVVEDQHLPSARASFARGESVDLGAVSLSHAGLVVRTRGEQPRAFTWREIRGIDRTEDGYLTVRYGDEWQPVAPLLQVANLPLLWALTDDALEYVHGAHPWPADRRRRGW